MTTIIIPKEEGAAPPLPSAGAQEPSMCHDVDGSAHHPPGDYAVIEIMGHQTLIGRIAEVTRFGAAMLQIEPIFAGRLLPPVLQGGASIYRLTPCDAATAYARAPKETQRWALPDAIKATLPPDLLPAPAPPQPDLVVDVAGFLGDADDDFRQP